MNGECIMNGWWMNGEWMDGGCMAKGSLLVLDPPANGRDSLVRRSIFC